MILKNNDIRVKKVRKFRLSVLVLLLVSLATNGRTQEVENVTFNLQGTGTVFSGKLKSPENATGTRIFRRTNSLLSTDSYISI